ncbi:MAG: AAA family ATPase [Nannocystis sp.]|uniref:AAA family ATPase n=1 Tax=Nannocystis sp. TaxID=1962667 RepID=UPI0024221115|nr:AAA family ATPase [Nannocystis sp.]MBK9752988.1 AAA family ATPase [Nannocystis sp.]
MLKLKRLKVHKCRSVQPGTELVFNGRLNIVLGKNGAGKTTLLKLVAAVVGSSFADEFQDDDIHVEYEYELHGVQVRCEFRHDDARVDDPVQATPMRLPIFQVTFYSARGDAVSARIRGNDLTITSGATEFPLKINPNVLNVPSLDLVGFIGSYLSHIPGIPEDLRPFATLDTKLPHRLDEGLDWLRLTLQDLAINFFSEIDDDARWCLANMRHSGVSAEFRGAFAEYRHRFAELPELLAAHSDALPFLRRACEQIGLRDASWTLSFLEHDRRRVEVKRYGRSQVYVTTHGGTRFPLEKLSFGQLRLFGFFLHSAMHPHVIVADELTNGLHHEMVDCCIATIGERQAFLATQNPLLLDHIGFDDAAEVQRTFVLCDLQGDPDGERAMRWRNMSADEAHEFFADYRVGVQHVNDILRKRGLW